MWIEVQLGMYQEGTEDDYIFGLEGVSLPVEVVLAQQMAAQTIQTTYRQELRKYGEYNSSFSFALLYLTDIGVSVTVRAPSS